MLAAEKNLLLAVRNRLRSQGPYTLQECEIEFDEMAPATVGNTYLAVMPAGWTPGPRHKTCGGISDLLYSVEVVVIKRITHVPRDRSRDVYFRNLRALTEDIDKVFTIIDFQYDLMNAANTLINTETGSEEGFIEPLKFTSISPKPQLVPAEVFAGTNEDRAGLKRSIVFGGARRITYKS
jgi:hypothetical protein